MHVEYKQQVLDIHARMRAMNLVLGERCVRVSLTEKHKASSCSWQPQRYRRILPGYWT